MNIPPFLREFSCLVIGGTCAGIAVVCAVSGKPFLCFAFVGAAWGFIWLGTEP